jgi:VIT1/CCC1 family predicted Fe2+/Mn2+ transporter
MAKSKVVLDKLEHTNKELDERLTSALMLALLLRDRVLHGVAPYKRSRPLLCLHCSFHLMFSALSHFHAPLLPLVESKLLMT